MVVDLADGVMELPPRLVEELGVGLYAVPEGLDPRGPLLLAAAAAAVHHLPPLLRSHGRRGPMTPCSGEALGFQRGGGLVGRRRLGFRRRVAAKGGRCWKGIRNDVLVGIL